MEYPRFKPALLHPRYWLIWLGMGTWGVITQILPFKVQMILGGWVGRLAARLSPQRRVVAQKNIDLCFPELSQKQRDQLLRQSMESVGRGLFDTAVTWFWPYSRLKPKLEVQGLELLEEIQSKGQGVIFVGVHFTSLEVSNPCVQRNHSYPVYAVYRAHPNPAYDFMQSRLRGRHSKNLLHRNDARAIIRVLRNGEAISYLPDQDYGHKHSVFAPFFGVEAATIASIGQLIKLGKARVLGYKIVRKKDLSGYLFQVYPESCFTGIGEGDAESDAVILNRFVEERVVEHPEQFLWVHRRFKSRPDHSDDFYGLKEMKSYKKRQKRREKRQKLQSK